MIAFKDLGIKAETEAFSGDKIKISRLLNREITVKRFKIVESKFNDKGNGKRLDMQIEIDGKEHICWTSSIILQATIKQVPADSFPFTTTIIENNERYEFT